jgi:hypothetical protein
MFTPLARRSLTACLVLAGSLLAAGCASAPPPPPDVVVVAPEPTAAPVAAQEEPADRISQEERVLILNGLLQQVTPEGPDQRVELEPTGRFIKRVSEDKYEEDFYLRDVAKVEYVIEEDWPNPHVARVFIKRGGVTRWHRGEDEWTISTIPHVSFVFATKEAASRAVKTFRALAKR